MAHGNPHYSTLEPYHRPSPNTPGTEYTAVGDGAYDSPADGSQAYYSAPEVYYPPQPDSSLPQAVNGYYAVKDADVLPEAVSKEGANNYGAPAGAGAATAGSGKRICGLTPKLFIIIAAIVGIVVVGAVVGGAVGATVGKKSSDSGSAATPTPTGNGTSPTPGTTNATTNVMDGSRLGAIAWKDRQGNAISSVFFQDASNGLGLSQYNSSTKKWDVKSVSDDLYNTTAQTVTPSAGTPLVPLCLGWVDNSVKIELYFLSASTTPTSIYSQTQAATGWRQDQLASSWTDHPLTSGSHLAVYEDYCTVNCANKTYVAGEGASHNFITFSRASPTANTWAYASVLVGISAPSPINLFQNSSIAYSRSHGNGTSTRDGLRMYVDVGGQLNEYIFDNATWNRKAHTWTLDEEGQAAYQSPDVSAVAFPDANKNEVIMFTILYHNNTAAVWWLPYNGVWNHAMAPVSDITAIALHDGPKAYTLSGGVISEYDINIASPAKWRLSSNVTTDYP